MNLTDLIIIIGFSLSWSCLMVIFITGYIKWHNDGVYRARRKKSTEILSSVGAVPFISDKRTILDYPGDQTPKIDELMKACDLKPGEGGFVVPWYINEPDALIEHDFHGTSDTAVWRDKVGELHWLRIPR